MHKAPGKSDREGISLVKLVKMFPNDTAACKWLEGMIWPNGPHCPKCGSLNVQCGIKHKTMTHRCRECEGKPRFSLKTGTIMESSKLGFQTWAIAVYLFMTNLKGVSSMKLHRDLEVTQKTAWHLAHRIRKAFESGNGPFDGPVEADETYMGGKFRNMHGHEREKARAQPNMKKNHRRRREGQGHELRAGAGRAEGRQGQHSGFRHRSGQGGCHRLPRRLRGLRESSQKNTIR